MGLVSRTSKSSACMFRVICIPSAAGPEASLSHPIFRVHSAQNLRMTCAEGTGEMCYLPMACDALLRHMQD